MKNEMLLHAFGQINDDLISDAEIEANPKKKRYWIPLLSAAACLCIIFAAVLGFLKLYGIQLAPEDDPAIQLQATTTQPAPDSGKITTPSNPDVQLSPSGYDVIVVRSLAQLEEMRVMAHTENEEELEAYLQSIEGGGATNRQELLDFLELVDSIPVLQFTDGSVCYISHQAGIGTGSGKYFNVLFISFERENGEWFRINYRLSVDDLSEQIEQVRNYEGVSTLDWNMEIAATGNRLRVFAEKRAPHPTGTGETIEWYLAVDDIFAEVTYYTLDADSINSEEIFRNLSVASIPDLSKLSGVPPFSKDYLFSAQAFPVTENIEEDLTQQIKIIKDKEELLPYLKLTNPETLSSYLNTIDCNLDEQTLIAVLMETKGSSDMPNVTSVEKKDKYYLNISVDADTKISVSDSINHWLLLVVAETADEIFSDKLVIIDVTNK